LPCSYSTSGWSKEHFGETATNHPCRTLLRRPRCGAVTLAVGAVPKTRRHDQPRRLISAVSWRCRKSNRNSSPTGEIPPAPSSSRAARLPRRPRTSCLSVPRIRSSSLPPSTEPWPFGMFSRPKSLACGVTAADRNSERVGVTPSALRQHCRKHGIFPAFAVVGRTGAEHQRAGIGA
jgi:hypothetical protein